MLHCYLYELIENNFTNEKLNDIVLDYENFIKLAKTIISEYE